VLISPVWEGANFFQKLKSRKTVVCVCVLTGGGNRTAQCNEEHACRHFSDEQNLKFS